MSADHLNKKQVTAKTLSVSQFGLRTLLAVMPAISFIFWLFSWLLRNDSDWWLLALVAAWAIGSMFGMLTCAHRPGRTLMASLCGGCSAVVPCLVIFLGVSDIPSSAVPGIFAVWIGIAAGASSVLAAIVGIGREGITASSK